MVVLPPCPTLRAKVAPMAIHDGQMLEASAIIVSGFNCFAGASIVKTSPSAAKYRHGIPFSWISKSMNKWRVSHVPRSNNNYGGRHQYSCPMPRGDSRCRISPRLRGFLGLRASNETFMDSIALTEVPRCSM